jgi:DNA replication protein DnaC
MTYLEDDELTRLEHEHPALATGICPTCKDKGNYLWQGVSRACDCGQQRRLYTRYLHAGIGILYQRLTMEDFEAQSPAEALAVQAVRDYIDSAEAYISRGIGLFISGPVGVGKTLLGMLVLKELVKAEYNCYATTFSNTVEAFTSTWGDNEEKRRFADRFMFSDVLFLDDLGQEQRTSNRLPQTTFDRILRTRVQDGRPTILTTNMNATEIKVGYGAPVLSLLCEQSIEIPMTGSDFRPRAHDRTIAEARSGEMRPIV